MVTFSTVVLFVQASESLRASFLYRKDLFQDWLMARALTAGAPPYRAAHLLAGELSNATGTTFDHASPHPPSLLPLLRPLAILEYETLATLWVGVEIAAVVAMGLLLRRLQEHTGKVTLLLVLIVLGSDPCRFGIVLGQFSCILAFLTAAFVVAQQERRDRLAGVALGLAVVIKFWGAPLFVWLAVQRRWRTLVYAGSTAALFHALSLVFLTPAEWLDYFLHVAPEVASRYLAHPANVSLTSVSPWLALGLVLFGAVVSLRRKALGLTFMLVLTPVVSPIAWLHGTVAWAIPFCMMLSAGRNRGLAAVAIALVLLGMTPPVIWPALERPLRLLPVFAALTYALWTTLGALLEPARSPKLAYP
ncbi:MAG: glycosyltransferase family 87 protein [Myxococcota bacterium]